MDKQELGRLISTLLVLLTPAMCLSEESFVGQWLSEKRAPSGIGKTLEISSDGRIRLSQGLVIGYQWVLQDKKKKRYTVQIVDPATGDRIRSVQLQVDTGDRELLVETDLVTQQKTKMPFVSRGHQNQDPPFLGRWQTMLPKFGLPAVYEFTDDGWLWLRAPIQADVGTYRVEGNRVIPQWPGEYSPMTELHYDGRMIIGTSADGFTEKFLRPKLMETLTSRPSDPRN